MALTLDRKAFIDILSEGKADVGGVDAAAAGRASGACRRRCCRRCRAIRADVEKSRAEARKIMEGLGYGADKPLKVKVSTRNIADLPRSRPCILIDQLKKIYIDGELERGRHQHLARQGDAQGVLGRPQPDRRRRRRSRRQSSTRTTACNSERNYTQYCNKEVDALIDKQSQETRRRQAQADRLGDRAASSPRTWRAADHPLRSRRHLLAAARQGLRAAPQQHLQQLALRGRLAGQVAAARRRSGRLGERAWEPISSAASC